MSQIPAFPSLAAFGRSQFSLPGFGKPAAQPEDYAPTPEEQTSYLGKVMGGVEGIGNTLDTPGAAVRGSLYGALTGDWSGLNTNVMSSEGRKYGSDFLDLAGWKEPTNWYGDPNESFTEALGDPNTYANSINKLAHKGLGLGIDIATDPLSMLSIGGKTAQGLGKIAEVGKTAEEVKNAALAGNHAPLLDAFNQSKLTSGLGSTPQTVAEEFRTGDRAMLGLHLPFWLGGKPIGSIWGTGTQGGELAAKLALGAGYAAPTRLMRGLFSDKVSPKVTRFAQAAQMANDAIYALKDNLVTNVREASEGFRLSYDKLEKGLNDIIGYHADNGNIAAAQEITRNLSTNKDIKSAADVLEVLNKDLANGSYVQEPQVLLAKLNDWTDKWYDYHKYNEAFKDAVQKQAQGVGIKIKDLQDLYVQHMPRSTSLKHALEEMKPEKERNEASRDVVGGEPAINEAAMDTISHGYIQPGADMSKYQKIIDKQPKTWNAETGQMKGDLWKAYLSDQLGIPSGSRNILDMRAQRLFDNIFRDKLNEAWADKTVAPRGGDGKILKDPQTGKYPSYVKFLSDGTPVDYAAEKSRWDPLNFHVPKKDGTPGAINENHPIIKLIKWMDGFDTKDEMGIPDKFKSGVYDNNVARDVMRYTESLTKRIATMQSAHNWMAGEGMTKLGEMEGGLPLKKAWDNANLHSDGLEAFVKNNYADEVNSRSSAITQKSAAADPTKITPKEVADNQAVQSIIEEMHITPRAAIGLSAYADLANIGMRTPKLLEVWDRYNTTFKNLLYNVWPASHIRDLLSRVWNASVAGKAPLISADGGGILGYTHQVIKHLSRVGKDGYTTPEWIREAEESGLFENFTAQMVQSRPGLWRANKHPKGGFLNSISPFNKGGTWNPLAIPGLGVSDAEAVAGKKVFNPVLAGMGAQKYGDYVGQVGYFGALKQAGYSTEQAKHLVKEAFYTLSEQTPFERHLLQRVMPFERFTVRNVPYQLAKLGTDPGGMTAQTLRGLTEGAQDKQYKPDFLREETAFPLGKAEPGQQQAFYRNTLIPLHELNDIALGRGTWGDIGRTTEKILSRFNPLLLAPIEHPFDPEGRQMFTGRKNKDLPYNWLENILRYSPLSRVVSTAEQVPGFGLLGKGIQQIPGGAGALNAAGLTPQTRTSHSETWPEFAANAAGLGRVSNYDTQNLQEADLRNALTEEAKRRGAKGTEDLFVPADVHKQQTPDEQAELKQVLKRRTGIIRRMSKERNVPGQQAAPDTEATQPETQTWHNFFGS